MATVPISDVLDDELADFMNLREADTGVPGTIYVSTELPGHRPRVKYFAGRAGSDQPSFSVFISATPVVDDRTLGSLPEHVVSRMSPLVIEWVGKNHEALARFWDEGTRWFADEVEQFRRGLRRLG